MKGAIEDYSESHRTTAELVIEVSLSSLTEDRELANIYAEANISEYWLFNLNNSIVEVYIKPKGGRYSEMKTYSENEEISAQNLPEVKVDLALLFGKK